MVATTGTSGRYWGLLCRHLLEWQLEHQPGEPGIIAGTTFVSAPRRENSSSSSAAPGVPLSAIGSHGAAAAENTADDDVSELIRSLRIRLAYQEAQVAHLTALVADLDRRGVPLMMPLQDRDADPRCATATTSTVGDDGGDHRRGPFAPSKGGGMMVRDKEQEEDHRRLAIARRVLGDADPVLLIHVAPSFTSESQLGNGQVEGGGGRGGGVYYGSRDGTAAVVFDGLELAHVLQDEGSCQQRVFVASTTMSSSSSSVTMVDGDDEGCRPAADGRDDSEGHHRPRRATSSPPRTLSPLLSVVTLPPGGVTIGRGRHVDVIGVGPPRSLPFSTTAPSVLLRGSIVVRDASVVRLQHLVLDASSDVEFEAAVDVATSAVVASSTRPPRGGGTADDGRNDLHVPTSPPPGDPPEGAPPPFSSGHPSSIAAMAPLPNGGTLYAARLFDRRWRRRRDAAVALMATPTDRSSVASSISPHADDEKGDDGGEAQDEPLRGVPSVLSMVLMPSMEEELATIVPLRSSPAVSGKGAGTLVTLSNCIITGGREGLHLSGRSSALCRRCTFVGNVRGIFESFQCTATVTDGCVFIGNGFHMVLLGLVAPTGDGTPSASSVGSNVAVGGAAKPPSIASRATAQMSRASALLSGAGDEATFVGYGSTLPPMLRSPATTAAVDPPFIRLGHHDSSAASIDLCRGGQSKCQTESAVCPVLRLWNPSTIRADRDGGATTTAIQRCYAVHIFRPRGDICLTYNPISDVYDDVLVTGGTLVVPTPAERTMGLSGPSW